MEDKLKSFYDTLKSNPNIAGLPADYDVFKNSLSGVDKAKGFYDSLKSGGIVRGLPDDFESFSKILPDIESNKPDSYAGDLIEKVGAGAANFSGNVYSAADKAYNFVLRPWVNLFRDDDGGDSFLKKQAESSYTHADELRKRSDRYEGAGFVDLWKKGDYSGAIGDVFLQASESLPQSLAAMMGGGVGLAVTGTASATGKYDELDKMPETRDLPEYQKIINAVSTGTFEAMSEKLGDIPIANWLKDIYVKSGKEIGERAVKSGFERFMKDSFKKYGVLVAPVSEGIEEVSSQMAENATDYFTGVSDELNLMDGVPEAFVYGVGGGAQFAAVGVPGLAMNKMNRRKVNSDYKKSKESLQGVFPDSNIQEFEDGISNISLSDQEEILRNMANNPDISEYQVNAVVDFVRKANQYRDYNSPEIKRKEKLIDQFREVANRKSGDIATGVDVDGNPVYVLDETGEGCLVQYQDGSKKFIPMPELYEVKHESIEDHAANFMNNLNLGGVNESNKEIASEPVSLGQMVYDGKTVNVLNQDVQNDGTVLVEDEEGNPLRVLAKDLKAVEGNDTIEPGVISDAASVDQSISDGVSAEVSNDGQSIVSATDENIGSLPVSYEVEKDVIATQQPDGSFSINKEFTKADLEKGQRFVERLNKDYDDEGLVFELAELPKIDPDNRFEKRRFGVVAKEKAKEMVEQPMFSSEEEISKWVAENSEDVNEILGTYEAVKGLRDDVSRSLPRWQQELLGRKIKPDSFYENGDRNHVTPELKKGWLSKDGRSVDELAHDLSVFGVEVTNQDIIDFMMDHPSGRVRMSNDEVDALGRRFSEVASQVSGMKIGRPDSPTGKLFVEKMRTSENAEQLKEQIESAQQAEEEVLRSIAEHHEAEQGDESYEPLTEDEISNIITEMKDRADDVPVVELSPENWLKEFGEDGMVNTPIGKVKMGDNQYLKLLQNGRGKQFGMVRPTLENPDMVVEDKSNALDGDTERGSSYVFVKTFKKDGQRYRFFTSVTVKREGLEVSISSHLKNEKRIEDLLRKGKLQYRVYGDPQTEHFQPNVSVTTSHTDNAGVSENKDIEVSGKNKERIQGIPRPLSDEDVSVVMSRMQNDAIEAPVLELTPDNWMNEFGEDGVVETPVGKVKMGENQYLKMLQNKREGQFGMVKPTLISPDIVVEQNDDVKDSERGSKLLFVKTFSQDGKKFVNFESVTVRKDGMEVSVSSHILRDRQLTKKLKEEKLIWNRFGFGSDFSGKSQDLSSSVTLNPNDIKPGTNSQINFSSENKDIEVSGENKDIDTEIKRVRVLHFDEKEYTGDVVSESDGRVVIRDDVTGREISVPEKRVRERLAPSRTSVDIVNAESVVNTSPTEAQKEAGNYRMGHVKINGFDVTIEQPKGSVRSGVDENGKEWSVTMNHTYGYLKGTKGKDGDHIDVFVGQNPDSENVFVVDQVNQDGSFDEHKVMIGFDSIEDAKKAYLSNYEVGWQGLGNITGVNIEEFREWSDSGTRKIKPFAEYKMIKDVPTIEEEAEIEAEMRSHEEYGDDGEIRYRDMTKDEMSSFAWKHGIAENDVKSYSECMRNKKLQGAIFAFSNIKRSVRLSNSDLSFGEFVKAFASVKAELYEKFGDVDGLRDEYVQREMEQRNMMEASRKLAEEEIEAERKRLEEFELMTDKEMDAAYFKAMKVNDEVRMRDIINEAARRNGYVSVDEFRMAHRAPSYDEEGVDKSMIDVAANKDQIRESLNEQLRMNRDKYRDESATAISEVLSTIDNGEKATVMIYRAAPKSLKEGSIRNGDWVSLSKSYVKIHGDHVLNGDYRIMKEVVPAENLYWDGNDINEWGYDDRSDYRNKDTKNNRKLNDLITRDDNYDIIPPSKRFDARNIDRRFRFIEENDVFNLDILKDVNRKFNSELQQQIDGKLPKGHVYKLGNPSGSLLSAGVPNLPIELSAERLSVKASKEYVSNHPFDLKNVENLPEAISNPIAVFGSTKGDKSNVILTELRQGKSHFVVILKVQNKGGGRGNVQINDIRSLYPKDNKISVVDWINSGLTKWVDKEKVAKFISVQWPNYIGNGNKNSNIVSAANVVKSFENPTVLEGEISSTIDELSDDLGVKVNRVKNRKDLPDGIQRRMKSGRYPGLYDVKTGEVYVVMDEVLDVADAQATVLHEVLGHKGIHGLFGDKLSDFCKRVLESMDEGKRAELVERHGGNEQLAAEEYVASFAEGYKDPTAWEKVKAIVMELLREMGIDLRLMDNDLKYVLWKAKNGLRESDGVMDAGKKMAKDREVRDALFRKGFGDESLEDVNRRFNEDLSLYKEGKMKKNESFYIGTPSGVLKGFLPALPIVMHQRVVNKGVNKKHAVDVDAIRDFPIYISAPIFVFRRDSHSIGILTEMLDKSGKNVCVAIEMNVFMQDGRDVIEINDVTSFHGRDVENVIKPIVNNNTLQYVDKKKGLDWISSALHNFKQETSNQDISDRTNVEKDFERSREIIEKFESPDINSEILFRNVSNSPSDFSNSRLSLKEIMREEFQDRMLSVKNLLDEVRRRGGRVTDYANPYIAENLASSKSMAQIDGFNKKILNPLMKSVESFVKNGKGRDEIEMYMMAKHAPERNARMMERNEVENGSGISNEDADGIVSDFEGDFSPSEIDKFWGCVREATKFTTETWMKHGLISKESKDYYDEMYEFYVPLRGWAESEADGIDYLDSSRGGGRINLNNKSKGRSSMADSPLAYIANMANSAIVAGNNNDVKRNVFEMMALNSNPDLYHLKKIYKVNTGTDENPVWIEQAERPSGDLWLSGRVEMKVNHRNDARREFYKTKQHQVEVFVNGQKYIMEFNGNMGVKVANAINGVNLRRFELLQNTIGRMTRWMSANYTSKNPAFVVTNFIRDFGYAVPAYWIKGGNAMVLAKNMKKAFAAIHNDLSGKDVDGDIQRFYMEFKDNGGLTGYVHMTDIDSYKKQIEREIRRSSGDNTFGDIVMRNKAMRAGTHLLDYLSQMSENSTRFAVYMSERESGKSAIDSAYAAKEITTNFNRKGRSSGLVGSLYAFFNATIQGSANALGLAKKYPGKFGTLCGSLILMQYLAASLCRALGGDDELGDSSYDGLSDWVKRNNLVLPLGDGRFLTIPLPHFLRAVSSLGVIGNEVVNGIKGIGEGVEAMFNSVAGDLTPVEISTPQFKNLPSFLMSATPTAMKPMAEAYVFNRNFMDLPISREPMGDQKKTLPQNKLASKRTNPMLVRVSEWMNEVVGGGKYTSSEISYDSKTGDVGRNEWKTWADINPSKFEHVVEGIYGGRLRFFNDTYKTVRGVLSGDVETSTIPVLRALVQEPYGEIAWRKFYDARDRVIDIDAKASEFMKTGQYDAYGLINLRNAEFVETFKAYESIVGELNDALRVVSDPDQSKNIEDRRYSVVKDFILTEKKIKSRKKSVVTD